MHFYCTCTDWTESGRRQPSPERATTRINTGQRRVAVLLQDDHSRGVKVQVPTEGVGPPAFTPSVLHLVPCNIDFRCDWSVEKVKWAVHCGVCYSNGRGPPPRHATPRPAPTQGQPDMDDRTSDMNPAAVLQLIRRTPRLCLQAEEPIYFPGGGGHHAPTRHPSESYSILLH